MRTDAQNPQLRQSRIAVTGGQAGLGTLGLCGSIPYHSCPFGPFVVESIRVQEQPRIDTNFHEYERRRLDATETDRPIRHYQWAGLDFLFDADGTPVFIEANRASHMLGEYMQLIGNDRPFELVADVMNRAPGPPCFLWRRGDPFPDADEDASFIGGHLSKHLREPPIIGNVEDNQEPREEFLARDGRRVRPGSLFRWWYGLPWSYERAGVAVINPNCLWVTVRDKLRCLQTLAAATSFRLPRAFAVENADDVRGRLADHPADFSGGYVLKPRVGWGGHGVQVAEAGDAPRAIGGNYLLSERVHPPKIDGRYWEARVFVMAGVYLGGVRYSSRSPMTNYWQGGTAGPLDEVTSVLLETPALEAVRLLDREADAIHRLPPPLDNPLTEVNYEGTGVRT